MQHGFSKGFGGMPGIDSPKRYNIKRPGKVIVEGHWKPGCPGMKIKQVVTYEDARKAVLPARNQLSLSPTAHAHHPFTREHGLRAGQHGNKHQNVNTLLLLLLLFNSTAIY